jgi:hypothetical protein
MCRETVTPSTNRLRVIGLKATDVLIVQRQSYRFAVDRS